MYNKFLSSCLLKLPDSWCRYSELRSRETISHCQSLHSVTHLKTRLMIETTLPILIADAYRDFRSTSAGGISWLLYNSTRSELCEDLEGIMQMTLPHWQRRWDRENPGFPAMQCIWHVPPWLRRIAAYISIVIFVNSLIVTDLICCPVTLTHPKK